MTMTRTLSEVLVSEGIADLTGLWPTDRVEVWNDLLDPVFSDKNAEARSYVGADMLVDVGIFQELFSEPVRQLIAGIQPSALLYHCHCYEIAACQTQSHIHEGILRGWHRDDETIDNFTTQFPSYISIFILLSSVGEDDGPFELQPRSPVGGLRARADVIRLVGPVGTAAIWNRSYFHRAAPNRGQIRRRILKVSFQPAGLPNDRISLPEFRKAMAGLTDPALRALVDERRIGTTDPLGDEAHPVVGQPMRPTGCNDLSSAAITVGRVQSAGRRILSAARAG